jgi:hypothetical protein
MINPEEYGDKRRNGTSTGQIRSIWTYLDKEEKDMVDTPSNLKIFYYFNLIKKITKTPELGKNFTR